MKKMILILAVLSALISFNGHGQGMQEREMLQQHRGEQLNMQHMQEMSRMMNQVQQMLGNMTGMFERDQIRSREQTQEMSQLMLHLSEALGEMSREMSQGELGEQAQEQLRTRLEDMEQQLTKLQKQIDQDQ